MNNRQKNYRLSLLWLGLFHNSILYTQSNWNHDQQYRKRYENHDHDNFSNKRRNQPAQFIEKDASQHSVQNYFTSLNIPQIGLGMGIGILCTLAWNLYKNPQTSANKKDKDHQNPDTDENNATSDIHTNKQDRSSALSYEKRIEIVHKSLHGMEHNNVNIPLIACLTQGYSRVKLEKFLKILKKSATEYNINFMLTQNTNIPLEKIYALDMNHVQLALEEMMCGSIVAQELDIKKLMNTAIHEAGHAIAVLENEKFILRSISIINRAQSLGRIIRSYTEDKEWTMHDLKDDIVVCLCGGIAEEIFGFDKSWYANKYPAARQKFDKFCLLAKNKNIKPGLAHLLTMPGAIEDMIKAHQIAEYMIKRYHELQSPDQDKNNKPGQIEDQICSILEECYQKAFKLIESHKAKIEQIAQLLMKHEIISGDTVYALCNMQRPLYTFEK